MCWMCDENEGESEVCTNCGRLICFDTKFSDDICAKAGVTASGDLYCYECARSFDDDEERESEESCDGCDY